MYYVLFVHVAAGQRGLEERLSTTQILLQQQKETVRRAERDRRAATDQLKDLERALHVSETDKKHLQVHTPTHTPCTCLHSSDHGSALVGIWQHSTLEARLQRAAFWEDNNNRCHHTHPQMHTHTFSTSMPAAPYVCF